MHISSIFTLSIARGINISVAPIQRTWCSRDRGGTAAMVSPRGNFRLHNPKPRMIGTPSTTSFHHGRDDWFSAGGTSRGSEQQVHDDTTLAKSSGVSSPSTGRTGLENRGRLRRERSRDRHCACNDQNTSIRMDAYESQVLHSQRYSTRNNKKTNIEIRFAAIKS